MGNRLFVGNLPSDISEKDVRGFVEGEGRTVQSVNLVKNKDPDRPRFAFVDLADEAEEKPGSKFGGSGGGGGFRSTPHGKEDRKGGGFGMRGQTALPRGSLRGGGRGGGRGS